jgi:hypothetical protein
MIDTESPTANTQPTTMVKSSALALRVTPHFEISRRTTKTVATLMMTSVTTNTVGPRS